MVGWAVHVVIVVVGEEGKTILVSKRSGRGGGQLESNITIITWNNSYCVCIYSRPDMSGLVGLRVGWHDGLVNASLGG